MNKGRKLQTAINLLRHKQTEDGTWLLGSRHSGKTYFEMEKPGEPSMWNTLRVRKRISSLIACGNEDKWCNSIEGKPHGE
jgi:hypothetical protein